MKRAIIICCGVGVAAWCGGGCSASSRQQTEEVLQEAGKAGERVAEASQDVARSLNDGGEGLSEAMGQVQRAVGVDGDVKPIDFRDLKPALPAALDGYSAGKAIGERTRVMGVATSQAEVRLTSDAGSIRVRIIDTGSVAGWAALAGRAAGAFVEVDRETENGFERAGVVDGVRTYESYDGASGQSSIRLFCADRFSIELEGQGASWVDMEAARDAVDLDRLTGLASASVETAEAPAEE